MKPALECEQLAGVYICGPPCPSLGDSWVRGPGAVLVAAQRGQEGGLFHSSPLPLKCVASIMEALSSLFSISP